MTLQEQHEFCEKFMSDCMQILQTKGADYSPEGKALRDVVEIADDLSVSPLKVLWVFARKHITAVRRFVKHGGVMSEPIRGRFLDLANYAALMAFVVERKEELCRKDT